MGKQITTEFLNKLIQMYESGMSISAINSTFHTDAYYHFKKHGIKIRSSGEQRRISRKNCITINWDCKNVNNGIEAYIIGLLMADGSSSGKQIVLCLKDSDSYLVEKIKNYFSPEITLQKRRNNVGFAISSQIICENLSQCGIKVGKTYSELSIPSNLSIDLIPHFIRGYFDGDGSIFVCKVKGVPKYLKGNICSPTRNILEEIQEKLKIFGIDSTINLEKRSGKTIWIPSGTNETVASCDMYRLFIRKKESLKKFYKLIYTNADFFLLRKKKVFDDFYHANTEISLETKESKLS